MSYTIQRARPLVIRPGTPARYSIFVNRRTATAVDRPRQRR